MFFLFPISRKTELVKFPWVTISLIALNFIVFVITWPSEKRFMHDRVSIQEYHEIAQYLASIALHAESGMPDHIKEVLYREKQSPDFPTPQTEEIFEKINDRSISLAPQARYGWDLTYPRYESFRMSINAQEHAPRSLYLDYAFYPQGPWFPGIITSQFLHGGILHLLFNMWFLWLVGCNLEERWGPYWFLILYLAGGAAGAICQSVMYPGSNMPMIGASGAIASLMGAFLIRFATMKIRFFYALLLIGIRFGRFYMPAWVALPLWLGQQLLMGIGTLHQEPLVGYWAHAGGFAFGLVGAALIRLFKLARYWEKQAEQTDKSCLIKINEAFRLLRAKLFDEAEKLFIEVQQANRRDIRTYFGLMRIYDQRTDIKNYLSQAYKLLTFALEQKNTSLADEAVRMSLPKLDEMSTDPALLFNFGSILGTMGRYKESVHVYRKIIELFPQTAYYPKAVFSAGRMLHEHLHQHREAVSLFSLLLKDPYRHEWHDIVRPYLKKSQ
ncbi:MAG: rhomboid family intramembrane serine protease [Elusimicrobia bacterium]|nr:rhomboid family intramembrane serine protease [Elusimicrobiota bacterium]MBD3412467.1 rhomboid family intramembrane serine protease [Elusimicrobiota bacterium]